MMATAYIPFFYIQDYALKLSLDTESAFSLLSIMNASSLLGRLAPNYLADRFGGVNVMLPCCLLSSLVIFIFPLAVEKSSLIAISVVYGFISGGMVSLPAPIIAALTSDVGELGARMGMAYSIAAFGGLVGSPVAGAAKRDAPAGISGRAVEDVRREFWGVWFVGGGGMLLATGFLVLTRWLKVSRWSWTLRI